MIYAKTVQLNAINVLARQTETVYYATNSFHIRMDFALGLALKIIINLIIAVKSANINVWNAIAHLVSLVEVVEA
jgi:hypothetical protein